MDYVQDYLFGTPPHLAAKNGNLIFCKSVIDQIKDENFQPIQKRKTHLHNAAERGHLPICQLILDRFENVFTL